MEIFSDIKSVTEKTNVVLAIGNFDGVHRGHQVLLQRAKDIARESNQPFAVLTFEPHPRHLFRPDEPPVRLTPPDVKAWRLKEFGVDILFSLPFNWDFASQSAENFIQHILIQGIGTSHVVVGYDFRFGQLRKGGPKDIEAAGIPVTVVEEVDDERGEALSSTRVRQLLRHGDIAQANQILGWHWEIWGQVMKGNQRGRELGYPTANIPLGDTVHPSYGIYATWVQIKGEDQWHASATNIGIRPMFEVPTAQVESYIFDFDREIYGQTLRIKPVKRLRGEAKFDSLEALKAQMAEDCREARAVLEDKADV